MATWRGSERPHSHTGVVLSGRFGRQTCQAIREQLMPSIQSITEIETFVHYFSCIFNWKKFFQFGPKFENSTVSRKCSFSTKSYVFHSFPFTKRTLMNIQHFNSLFIKHLSREVSRFWKGFENCFNAKNTLHNNSLSNVWKESLQRTTWLFIFLILHFLTSVGVAVSFMGFREKLVDIIVCRLSFIRNLTIVLRRNVVLILNFDLKFLELA